ncbi:late histone H2A.3, gonadal-like [Topomyia yanbarensis]|uniref:late histone H2A.3, gonadal-like n=1 Tax=Topomyia yanbarensis TaxID=2498891 RepID=UPI00273B9E3E|nr:late histone H2A.3, gonadal-like [Topomyia yanbarensis]
MEYLGVLDLAGNATCDNKQTRSIPRHLKLSIRNDEELEKLLSGVTFSRGGVLPNIRAILLPKKTKKKPKKSATTREKKKNCGSGVRRLKSLRLSLRNRMRRWPMMATKSSKAVANKPKTPKPATPAKKASRRKTTVGKK